MAWRAYRACCEQSGQDPEAAYCEQCGNVLIRCPGCKRLLQPFGHCESCVQPGLFVDKGASLSARRGEILSIPFVLSNASPEHTLLIESIEKREHGQPSVGVPLAWEKLAPRQARGFPVTLSPLSHGGMHTLELFIRVASDDDIPEEFVFTGSLGIDVADDERQQTTINVQASGTGALIHNLQVAELTGGHERTRIEDLAPIRLDRAERTELESGVRGYPEMHARVARDAVYRFSGFPDSDLPRNGQLVLASRALRVGRNSVRFDAEQNPHPSDLALRLYRRRDGELDRDGSMALSREHFELQIRNARLYLKAVSLQGVRLNDRHLSRGETQALRHDDIIAPLAANPRDLSIRVRFEPSGRAIKRILLERLPPVTAPQATEGCP